MKNLLLIALCAISFGAWAQVQINKPLQLSGSGTDARIEGIEDVSANDHAANKIYVDTTVANALGGPGNMNINFTSSAATATTAAGFTTTVPIELSLTYLSGTPAPVRIEVSGLPAGVTHELSPSGGYPSFSSQLYFTASGIASPGSYSITFTAIGGASPQSLNITLNVLGVKRVFVTSTLYSGNLGGLSGADTECANHAASGSLGGTWKAWLSTGTVHAKDRINDGLFTNVTGDQIASNKAELLNADSDPLDIKIYQNETGANQNGQQWTGTDKDGTAILGYNCSNWTDGSNGSQAKAGYNLFQDGRWTFESNEYCNGSYHIYCFEQ